MKIEVRYLSKGGNTKKVADAIAEEVGANPLPITEPVTGGADILFLGAAIYVFGVDEQIKTFIKTLDSSTKKVVLFSTTALVKSAYPQLKKLLEEQKIAVSEKEFHCKGEYKIMHKGKPNIEDLKDAKAFARKVIG